MYQLGKLVARVPKEEAVVVRKIREIVVDVVVPMAGAPQMILGSGSQAMKM
jgi:hypothetical protein